MNSLPSPEPTSVAPTAVVPPPAAPTAAEARAAAALAAASKPRSFFHVLTIAVLKAVGVLFILFVLLGVLFPFTSSSTCGRSPQTKALAQAKQIGLALKLYASDHDGVYPAGVNADGETIRTSNDAFRSLFPAYLQTEMIFGNKLSAYQTAPPDNIIATEHVTYAPGQSPTLHAGENVYAYVMGTNESLPPTTPLVMDGTDGTGRGTYSSDQSARGGVWKGQKAVVVFLDNSAAVENLTGPANARYIAQTLSPGKTHNPLDPAELAASGLKLLDPAVAPKAGKPAR